MAPHLPPYVTRLIEFDERNPIFDQQTYEMRIRAEADIMIALEAEKTDIVFIYKRLDELSNLIGIQRQRVVERAQLAQDNLNLQERAQHEYDNRNVRMQQLQDECGASERKQDEHRRMLVLYCQQFAFAAEMQRSCADLLSCR
mmetsp:Transcript_11042/g.13957  ORF Transcript_11042/g.13957 Transcript_11042/m.13957 type:complete len:143 (-) Transcript_11042:436-864(-)